MFRHEKPQKGRYRQFHQLGVEALGISGTGIELELIALCKRFWSAMGIEEQVQLQINTLGEIHERQRYKEILTEFLSTHFDALDEDSQRRLYRNPLRILDSKNPAMQSLLADAPKLIDSLGESSRRHFLELCSGLERLNISYTINPQLVRGLDYYGHTVFEWVTDKLGSQATVCAGGRYDALIEQLGGSPAPAVGFAIGIERMLLLLETLEQKLIAPKQTVFFIVSTGQKAIQEALMLAEKLRDACSSWQIITNSSGGSFKSQFKKADKSGADYALIIGEDELINQHIGLKNLRNLEEQLTIPQSELIQYLLDHLG